MCPEGSLFARGDSMQPHFQAFLFLKMTVACQLLVGNGPWPKLIHQLHPGIVSIGLLGINQNHVRDYVKNVSVASQVPLHGNLACHSAVLEDKISP